MPTKQRFAVMTDRKYAPAPEALAECRDAGLLGRDRSPLRHQHCDTPTAPPLQRAGRKGPRVA